MCYKIDMSRTDEVKRHPMMIFCFSKEKKEKKNMFWLID